MPNNSTLIGCLWLILLSLTRLSHAGSVELTADEQAFIDNTPVIKVANELDWPPFDFNQDGVPSGLAIDYFKLVASKVGLQVEFVNGLNWTQLLEAFEQHRIDVMPVLYQTPERESFTLYTRPYYEVKIGVLTRSDNDRIHSLSDLRGKHVGIISGHAVIPLVKEALPGGIILETHPNAESLVRSLNNGQLDAIVDNPLLFNYYARSFGVKPFQLIDHINMTPQERRDNSMHIGVHKTLPLLRNILDKAVATITPQEFKAIERRWIQLKNDRSEISLSLTADEKAYLKSKPHLNLCIDPNWLPYEAFTKKGELVGMTAGHFKLFSERLGVDFKPNVTRLWNDSLAAIKDHSCDVLALANRTESRAKYMLFTSPYVSFPYVVATKDDRLFIDEFSQELDKPFSVVRGYAVIDYLQETYPTIKLVEVDNVTEGLELVRNGTVFGYVGATAVIAYTIRTEEFTDLKIAARLASHYSLRTAVRDDEPILRGIMQKAIDSLSVEERDSIYNRWVETSIQPPLISDPVRNTLVASTLALVLVMLWNRKLNSERQRVQLHNVHLEQLSCTDNLTKVFNRTRLEQCLLQEIDRAEHYNSSFSIILLDVDHFKQVNDTYGHQVGDQVLIAIADLLNQGIRQNDILCRWGGEEFVILCPGTELNGAQVMATNLRQQIAGKEFDQVGQKTASFGITVYRPGDSAESVFKRVDQGLYQAKESGRNRIEVV